MYGILLIYLRRGLGLEVPTQAQGGKCTTAHSAYYYRGGLGGLHNILFIVNPTFGSFSSAAVGDVCFEMLRLRHKT
jgi:hypothetical protein